MVPLTTIMVIDTLLFNHIAQLTYTSIPVELSNCLLLLPHYPKPQLHSTIHIYITTLPSNHYTNQLVLPLYHITNSHMPGIFNIPHIQLSAYT